jgi:hypothetical protein
MGVALRSLRANCRVAFTHVHNLFQPDFCKRPAGGFAKQAANTLSFIHEPWPYERWWFRLCQILLALYALKL